MKEHTNDMNNSRAIFFIFLLLAQYPAYCQKDMGKQRYGNLKYRFVEPKLTLHDTIRFRKITENVYYTIEYATISRKKIVAVKGCENERNAFFSSFGIALTDFCRKTNQYQFIYLERSNDSSINVGIRCLSDYRTLLDNIDNLSSLENQCFSTCECVSLSSDSILTTVYQAPRNVSVSKINRTGAYYSFEKLPNEMDECGIVVINIPTNEESLYAFSNKSTHLCILRVVPRDILTRLRHRN
jgi:hypothetical protein